jgi:hypothetical protein
MTYFPGQDNKTKVVGSQIFITNDAGSIGSLAAANCINPGTAKALSEAFNNRQLDKTLAIKHLVAQLRAAVALIHACGPTDCNDDIAKMEEAYKSWEHI